MSAGLHVIFGLTGLPFVGYAGLFGVGAYVAALMNTRWHIDTNWALLVAPIVTSALSLVLALLFIRLKDVYFMIVSLAVGQLIPIIAAAWAVTGGPNGLYGIAPIHIAGHDFIDLKSLYYLSLVFVLASIVFLAVFGRSRTGVSWLAIGRDENAAEALGIRTKSSKVWALTLGGAWAGLAGTLYAAQLSAISPDAFTVYDSILLASAVLIGGRGSLGGTVLGAAVLYALPEIFRELAEYRLLVFGVAIMVILKVRPEGLLPRRSRQFKVDPVAAPESVAA